MFRGSLRFNSRAKPDSQDHFLKEEDLPNSMEDVLENRDLRVLLLDFLERRLANENLLFYESIENYEKLETPELRKKAGLKIIEEFILENAIYCVNISSSLRKDLKDTQDFAPETFSLAKNEIFKLLATNFFDSFRRNLAGSENDAPYLGDDLNFPDFTKSMTFVNLSEALGDNVESSEVKAITGRGRGSQINLLRNRTDPESGIPTLIRRKLQKKNEETESTRNSLKIFALLKGGRRSLTIMKEFKKPETC